MFSSFKNLKVKSEVSSLAKSVLVSVGEFSDKFAIKLSSKMTDLVWEQHYQLVSGKVYKQPNKFSCAMLVVSTSVLESVDHHETLILARCYESLTKELEVNGELFDFNEVDERIIEKSLFNFASSEAKLQIAHNVLQQAITAQQEAERKKKESSERNKSTDWSALAHLFEGKVGFSKQFQPCKVCGSSTGQTLGEYFICNRCKSDFELRR
ncbi:MULTISPECIES: hypothetical protein [Vibrio]|uniref:hypothetical protein n=1 Tax=Vibrio TaxID=662 RepID=UPI001BD36328|nr:MULTISPECIES: hypothetical protein [Vibrio]EGQ9099365.1 hypothetical protein [Vibrio alginolyticus]MBT0029770.1 hypothetical protein [Vibrio alginolyticus]MBT0053665.1 hypothetical protein [Vibrio alginolyticus]MDW1838170.1 hypothetical protein [Vibrio sp. Vb0718]MDW2080545.1 hypothetical protein [Vibrio sp. 1640]